MAGAIPMDTSTEQPSARPMRADARRNHDRLIGEARRSFAEHGTDASLEDIARRAGVGIGTLYRHFPNRDALMNAVFQDALCSLLDRSRELAAAEARAGRWWTGWARSSLMRVSTAAWPTP